MRPPLSSRPSAALTALALSASLAGHALCADNPDRVDILLAQSRAALGGDAIASGKVLKIDSTISVGGLNGTGTAWREIGSLRFAETATVSILTQTDGYNGRDVWNRDGAGLVWVDGGRSGRTQQISLGFAANYALWGPARRGAEISWGGARTDAGREFEVLQITAPGASAPFELWFDAKTHLPARFSLKIGPNTSTESYADYRPVRGLMIPFKVHGVDLQGNETDLDVTAVAAVPDGATHLAKPVSDAHDFSMKGGRTETTVPMELVDNHVYVPVMVDGKGPYRFILDTGGENILDPAVAAEIGATGQGSLQGSGSGSSTQAASFARIDRLTVGDATLRDQSFAIAPVRKGFGISGGQQVDGLLGFEILARFVTTYDYGRRRVVFQLPGAHDRSAGGQRLPFVLDGRTPQIACVLDSVPGHCSLDTGARNSLSLYSLFAQAHPEIAQTTLTAIGVNGFGFGGPSLGRLGRLQTLRIGAFALTDIVADFNADENGSFAMPFLAANVGGNVLRRFSLTLDYGHQALSLTPNADFATPDDYEHAGLFLINRDGKYVVIDARPGTAAAEAGIAKGDVLESIDGTLASGLSLQAVRDRFLGPPGRRISLGLLGKDGTRRTILLTLRRII